MTTEVKRGPCATDRCERAIDDSRCGRPREEHPLRDHRELPLPTPDQAQHEYRPHQHTLECSARFYREFFGCDVRTVSSGIWCALNHPPHDEDRSREVKLADILGSPESDASWLAMRAVLAEVHRRGWYLFIETDPDPAHNGVHVHENEAETGSGPLASVYGGDLPRAVALAAWQAVSE